MRKIRKKIRGILTKAIALIVVGSIVVYGVFHFIQNSQAAWFDDSFQYRQKVVVTNSSGSTQTDFQVMITIDTTGLITAGKMQGDCDDIRITDNNGKKLPYWLEPSTCNTSTTKVWTKAASINTSTSNLYIYYGSPNASSESSTTNTFIREITGVQGAWNMDEASGTSVADTSGGSNTGTVTGATVTSGKGSFLTKKHIYTY